MNKRGTYDLYDILFEGVAHVKENLGLFFFYQTIIFCNHRHQANARCTEKQ